MLNKLKEKGLKCNIEGLFFGKNEMEYLGFWVAHNCVKIINRKIETITNTKPPNSQKKIRKFIGRVPDQEVPFALILWYVVKTFIYCRNRNNLR